jgi:ATP-dependent DNA ligase
MLCYPFEEKRLAKWKPPWIIQPKLDGVRCRALIKKETVTLISSELNEIVSVPHINRQLSSIGLTPGLELDGELYIHGKSFEEIFSRVSREKNLHPESEEVEFHVFDLVDEVQRQDLRLIDLVVDVQNQLRFGVLHRPVIQIVPIKVVETLDEIMREYESFMRRGYEGFILRHLLAPYVRRRSTFVMKFKPKKKDIYRIVGTTEEIDQFGSPKGTLGSIACISDEEVFFVGSGFTREEREQLWKIRETLPGQYLQVAYQNLTSLRGVPRFPVHKGLLQSSKLGAVSSENSLGDTLDEDDGYAD